MFATTEPEKVLPTILSRCQRFDLRRIPVALIVRHLAHIADLEKVNIEEAALYAIARGAEGGMRDAESALDQLISFCGEKIVENDVLSMFGLTAQGQIVALASAVLKGDCETALRELHELARHGKDLGRFLADLLAHFRNLLIYQVSRGDLKLLEVSEADAASLKEQASAISTEALTRIMEVLTDSESRLREAASKKIFVEVALLKAIQAREAVHIDAVLKHLQQLRADQPGAAAQPQPSPARAPSSNSRNVGKVLPAEAGVPPGTPALAGAILQNQSPPAREWAPDPSAPQAAPPQKAASPAASTGDPDLASLLQNVL